MASPRDVTHAFDPNTQSDPYGTYVYSRHPKWKLHRSRASALSSIGGWDNCALFLFGRTGWEKQLVKSAEDHNCKCQHCGGPTTMNSRYGKWRAREVSPGVYDVGEFVWVRDRKNKIVDPPQALYVCGDCRKFYR